MLTFILESVKQQYNGIYNNRVSISQRKHRYKTAVCFFFQWGSTVAWQEGALVGKRGGELHPRQHALFSSLGWAKLFPLPCDG